MIMPLVFCFTPIPEATFIPPGLHDRLSHQAGRRLDQFSFAREPFCWSIMFRLGLAANLSCVTRSEPAGKRNPPVSSG
jgi:hypothetical protein